jgi:hypothetical protein
MTDILERIDKHLINDDAEQRNWDADGLLEDAAVEIEKLRLIHTDLRTLNGKQEREIETLKESLKKANAANSRLAQCNHKISAEVANAREEIREMNGRIDNLQWRGRWLPRPKQE